MVVPIPYSRFVALALIDVRADEFGFICGTASCGTVVAALVPRVRARQ